MSIEFLKNVPLSIQAELAAILTYSKKKKRYIHTKEKGSYIYLLAFTRTLVWVLLCTCICTYLIHMYLPQMYMFGSLNLALLSYHVIKNNYLYVFRRFYIMSLRVIAGVRIRINIYDLSVSFIFKQ